MVISLGQLQINNRRTHSHLKNGLSFTSSNFTRIHHLFKIYNLIISRLSSRCLACSLSEFAYLTVGIVLCHSSSEASTKVTKPIYLRLIVRLLAPRRSPTHLRPADFVRQTAHLSSVCRFEFRSEFRFESRFEFTFEFMLHAHNLRLRDVHQPSTKLLQTMPRSNYRLSDTFEVQTFLRNV